MTEIIHLTGTREEKIAAAQKIKSELESAFPEFASLRQQLVDLGMCKNDLSSVVRVVTENIEYNALRDDPDRYARKHRQPPIITPEIRNAVQDRTWKQTFPAEPVSKSRGGHRRR